ncbi:MAG: PDZ domain-containing protein [Oscillospiraceae bacterium]|nr:PDZ domain-containing protein [Oscillospiraceae bacterium]
MKKGIFRICFFFIIVWALPVGACARVLIPVGQIIGLELGNNTVTVAALEENSTAGTGGLQVGDRIVKIDGCAVSSAQDVRRALESSDGAVDVVVQRSGKAVSMHLQPAITEQGPRLGVYLRNGITGIGTVTFYDPQTGLFGTLGHGVNDDTGALLRLTGGKAYRASILSVRRGRAGEPGQLMGALSDGEPVGTLDANTDRGVFGRLNMPVSGEAMEVGNAEDVKVGPATIRSTVNDSAVREYSVEILKIYPKGRAGNRNMLLKVTDPALLEATGGIVQGMSGSPIIQDGKLVGAVTHVLVNDPTTGYGIFIENMLDAAA